MSEYPEVRVDPEATRWVDTRGRIGIALGAGLFVYALMVIAPTVGRLLPMVGESVLFLPSLVVLVGMAWVFWMSDPRIWRAALRAVFWYLLLGLAGTGLLVFIPAAPVQPQELGVLVVVAWPTMWLWMYGCMLPLLSACA